MDDRILKNLFLFDFVSEAEKWEKVKKPDPSCNSKFPKYAKIKTE